MHPGRDGFRLLLCQHLRPGACHGRILLGIAGASFGVALALGSGWFPPEYKGLAMGIAGAGNSGTAIATLFRPRAGHQVRLATCVRLRGPDDAAALLHDALLSPRSRRTARRTTPLSDHIKCLWQADGWMFNAVYIITFGGFIGLATYLPSFFHDQFGVTKIQAGVYTTIATFLGSGIRIVGGYVADRLGGILTLTIVMLGIIGAFLGTSIAPSLTVTIILFMCCFAVSWAWATGRCSNWCRCAGRPRRRSRAA